MWRRCASTLIVVSVLVAGCNRARPVEPEPDDEPGVAVPAPTRSPTPSPRPPASPSPTGFGEAVAVPCGGRPSGEQVIALLRRSSVLPAGARPAVVAGPLCAGTWQYTALSVPDHDALYAVSQGPPTALTLVTAGTNPCSAKVRAGAPPGILSAIRC